jgi:3-oxoacyl-[acyl-carrier-protein] synthase II
VISPIGLDTASFSTGLLAGTCAIRRPPWALEGPFRDVPEIWGATVDGFDPLRWMSPKVASATDRFTQYGLAAAAQAVEASGIGELPPRTAVVFGTSMGGIQTIVRGVEALRVGGIDALDRRFHITAWPYMAAAQIALRWRLHGPLLTVVTACASSLDAIGIAADLVRSGRVDVALAGGSDCGMNPLVWSAGHRYGMARPGPDPEGFCKPFDVDRAGVVEGEGAGMVVVESERHLVARDGHSLARVVGYGSASDGTHPSRPDPEGVWEIAAMREALAAANAASGSVDALMAHATGTPMGDLAELHAINAVFGGRSSPLPVTSFKGGAGHAAGGAGAHAVIAATEMLRLQVVPHSVGTINVEPAARFEVVTERPLAAGLRRIQVNAFGFGGYNSSMLLEAS